MPKKRRTEDKKRSVEKNQAGKSGLEILPLDTFQIIAKKLVETNALRTTQVVAADILAVLSTSKALHGSTLAGILWNELAEKSPSQPPCPLNVDFKPLSEATAPSAPPPASETRLTSLRDRRKRPQDEASSNSQPTSWKDVANVLSLDPSRFSTSALRTTLRALGVVPGYWADDEELEEVLGERLKHSGEVPMQVVIDLRRQVHTYLSAATANQEYRLTPTMLSGLTRVEPLAFHGTRESYRLLDVVQAAQQYYRTAAELERRREAVAAANKARSASQAALRQARVRQMAMAWLGANEPMYLPANFNPLGPVDEDGICPECGVPWRDHY